MEFTVKSEYEKKVDRYYTAWPNAYKLIKSIADEYTGRDPMALVDCNIGEWAEEILAYIEDREPIVKT